MGKICDLYLCDSIKSDRLRFIRLFAREFSFDPDVFYRGYLRINVDRVKLVSVISELRKGGIKCFSVPVEYRDRDVISVDEAFALASEYAHSLNLSITPRSGEQPCEIPLFWSFNLTGDENEKVGGIVMVDRMDGHIWKNDEYEEYMYDYNNVF
jgi:hypothetical protein